MCASNSNRFNRDLVDILDGLANQLVFGYKEACKKVRAVVLFVNVFFWAINKIQAPYFKTNS